MLMIYKLKFICLKLSYSFKHGLMRIIDIKAIIIIYKSCFRDNSHKNVINFWNKGNKSTKNHWKCETQWEYKFDSRITNDLIRSVSNPICYIKWIHHHILPNILNCHIFLKLVSVSLFLIMITIITIDFDKNIVTFLRESETGMTKNQKAWR